MKQKSKFSKQTKIAISLTIIIVFIVIAVTSIQNAPYNIERSKEQTAIDACWKNYKIKVGNDKTLVESECKQMEIDFKLKYD